MDQEEQERDVYATIEDLREAVRERVEQSSLRSAGLEVGMNHAALRKFIDGEEPHPGSLLRLRSWHESRQGGRPRLRLIP